jgi:type II secretory pathway component GspD/PulD (secretin)
MPRIMMAAILTILAVASGTAVAETTAVGDGASTREFELKNVQFPDAAIVLRTMAGTRQLERIDDRRLRVTDTPEILDVAERVMQMIDFPSPNEDGFESFTVPPGDSVIAGIRLRAVTAPDAMDALRILRVSRIAPCCNDALMVLRDTQEQIDAARKLIQVMERMCPAPE